METQKGRRVSKSLTLSFQEQIIESMRIGFQSRGWRLSFLTVALLSLLWSPLVEAKGLVQWFQNLTSSSNSSSANQPLLVKTGTTAPGTTSPSSSPSSSQGPATATALTQNKEIYRAHLQLTHLLVSKILVSQMTEFDQKLIKEPFQGGDRHSEITKAHYYLLMSKKVYIALLTNWQKRIDEMVLADDPSQWLNSTKVIEALIEKSAFLRTHDFLIFDLLKKTQDFKMLTERRHKLLRRIIDEEKDFLAKVQNNKSGARSLLLSGDREIEMIKFISNQFLDDPERPNLNLKLLALFSVYSNPRVVNYVIKMINYIGLRAAPKAVLKEEWNHLKDKARQLDKKRWVSNLFVGIVGGGIMIFGSPAVIGSTFITAAGHFAIYKYLLKGKAPAGSMADIQNSESALLPHPGFNDFILDELRGALNSKAFDMVEKSFLETSSSEKLLSTPSYQLPAWVDQFRWEKEVFLSRDWLNSVTHLLKNRWSAVNKKSSSLPPIDYIPYLLSQEWRRFSASYHKDTRLYSMAVAAHKALLAEVRSIPSTLATSNGTSNSSPNSPSNSNSNSSPKSQSHGAASSSAQKMELTFDEGLEIIGRVMDSLNKKTTYYYLAGSDSLMRSLIGEGQNCVSDAAIKASLLGQVLDPLQWTVGVSFIPSHVRAVVWHKPSGKVIEVDASSPMVYSIESYRNSIYHGDILLWNQLEESDIPLSQLELFRPKGAEGANIFSFDFTKSDTESGFQYFKSIIGESRVAQEGKINATNPEFAIQTEGAEGSMIDGSDMISSETNNTLQMLLTSKNLKTALSTLTENLKSRTGQRPTTQSSSVEEGNLPKDSAKQVICRKLHDDTLCLVWQTHWGDESVAKNFTDESERDKPLFDEGTPRESSRLYIDQSGMDLIFRRSLEQKYSGQIYIRIDVFSKDDRLLKVLREKNTLLLQTSRVMLTQLQKSNEGAYLKIWQDISSLQKDLDNSLGAGAMARDPRYLRIQNWYRSIKAQESEVEALLQIISFLPPSSIEKWHDLMGVPKEIPLYIRQTPSTSQGEGSKMGKREKGQLQTQKSKLVFVKRDIFGKFRPLSTPHSQYFLSRWLDRVIYGPDANIEIPLSQGPLNKNYLLQPFLLSVETSHTLGHRLAGRENEVSRGNNQDKHLSDGLFLLPTIAVNGMSDNNLGVTPIESAILLGKNPSLFDKPSEAGSFFYYISQSLYSIKDDQISTVNEMKPFSLADLKEEIQARALVDQYRSKHPAQTRFENEMMQLLTKNHIANPHYKKILSHYQFPPSLIKTSGLSLEQFNELLPKYQIELPEITQEPCQLPFIPQGVDLPKIGSNLCQSPSSSSAGYIRCLPQHSQVQEEINAKKTEKEICRDSKVPFNFEVSYKKSTGSIRPGTVPLSLEAALGNFIDSEPEGSQDSFLSLVELMDKDVIEHIGEKRDYYRYYWGKELSALCQWAYSEMAEEWDRPTLAEEMSVGGFIARRTVPHRGPRWNAKMKGSSRIAPRNDEISEDESWMSHLKEIYNNLRSQGVCLKPSEMLGEQGY